MGIHQTMKAMSDPIRRKILDLLREKPLTAGEISEHFELSGATISHHLSTLKDSGLIDCTRNGTFLIYELNTSLVEDVIKWLSSLSKGE